MAYIRQELDGWMVPIEFSFVICFSYLEFSLFVLWSGKVFESRST
jgi:hypothetical protein